MTQPEKEFEVGRYATLTGNRVLIHALSTNGRFAAIERDNGDLQWALIDDLKPWKPDPKPKFEEELEAIAKEVIGLGIASGVQQYLEDAEALAARIRALTPDPAAAVAGSAEPVGHEVSGYFSRKVLGFLSSNRDAARFMPCAVSNFPDEVLDTPFYLALPPPNPAAFDEAAERKLFESKHRTVPLAWCNDGKGFYINVQTDRLWQSWLASAKVQRGAVPAVVPEIGTFMRPCCGQYETCLSACTPRGRREGIKLTAASVSEVRKELLEIAGHRVVEGTGLSHDLRSLASRLGGAS